MKLHTGNLYWPTTLHVEPLPKPERKKYYDCLIVGGGISGLLVAYKLIGQNLSVALLERHEVAQGSTAANTGLLQYANDRILSEFIQQIGEDDAVSFYQLCYAALDELEKVAHHLPEHADFVRRPSIYFASSDEHIQKVRNEYEALKKHQFNVQLWDEQLIQQNGFQGSKAALISEGDAEVNPYKLTNYLAAFLVEKGLHIFEQTDVVDVQNETEQLEDEAIAKGMQEQIVVHTTNGTYTTGKIIYTTGYTSPPYDEVNGALVNRSYVVVSEPLEETQNWYRNALIWESASPYLYLRFTADNRMIIGGRDEETETPSFNLQKIEDRANQLIEDAKQYIPNLKISPRFSYCASFGESTYDLPFIGEHPEQKNHYYLLGFGGNGTVYSMIGANIICDLITKNKNAHSHLFKFSTKNLKIPKLNMLFPSIIDISN